MSKRIEIVVGSKYGRLTVVREVEKRRGRRLILCSCSCGGESVVMPSHLNTGHTKTCGKCYSDRAVDQALLREIFSYNEYTGNLVRIVKTGDNVRVGDVAGSISNHGYYCTRVQGKSYLNHRLIWLYIYGYMPEQQIDHIDRDRLNNSLSNLREVSQSCNMRNSGISSLNTSGVKGVGWDKEKRKWSAIIVVNKKTKHIGYFSDKVEAISHRLACEQCVDFNICNNASSASLAIKSYIEGA